MRGQREAGTMFSERNAKLFCEYRSSRDTVQREKEFGWFSNLFPTRAK
jgi:hypothetical protein